MAYKHWFVSRQKRKLTTILQALVAYSDVCVGKVWNEEIQLILEDVLGRRLITEHGSLRARRAGQGGGGTRTLFKQMKDLGLVFTEDDNRRCRLTLIGEEIVKGNITFVDAMRLQLQRYQYPSATSWAGSGSVDHCFKVHPFQFLFRLLRDERIENIITMDEMSGIIIHYAKSDGEKAFKGVVEKIIRYRNGSLADFITDTDTKTYSNIANTFFNYLNLTQYVDRGQKTISIKSGKENVVDDFIEENPTNIPNPEIQENYLRRYGRGLVAMDRRNFNSENAVTKKELNEARIRYEYVLLALKTPITGITPDVIEHVSHNTGIDEKIVEKFLLQNYPKGNIDDFFLSYRELANMGRAGAKDFELATCEMFRKIFNMHAKHVGSKGNTPDVFIESVDKYYCGIIDNKAYRTGYSISGDHKRVMENVYIKNYKNYGKTDAPLAFFSYIAGSFGKNINSQVSEIAKKTGICGSAMPVDIFINLAQDYAKKGYDHGFIKRLFSLNHEVGLEDVDIEEKKNASYDFGYSKCRLKIAENDKIK